MNVVIDIQSLQRGSRYRGIGRATLEIMEELAKKYPFDLRIFALYDASILLPREIAEEIKSYNIECVPFHPYLDSSSNAQHNKEVSEKLKQFVVKSLNSSIYIGPHIFEDFGRSQYDLPVPKLKNMCIFYDAIPMQLPEIYLSDPEINRSYFSRVEILRSYDLILGLSNSSLNDGIDLLQIDSSKTMKIGGGFKESSVEIREVNEDRVFTFLYFGAFDPRKNVQLLIKSFAELVNRTDLDTKLVLAGHVQDYDSEIKPLLSLAQNLGVADKIEFKGFIKKVEISSLYLNADVYVQTSLAEGLGLGLFDAIAHGIPAIACGIPSAKEVLGGDKYLFKNDVKSLSNLMQALQESHDLRREFFENQKSHANLESWDVAAQRIFKVFREYSTKMSGNKFFSLRSSYEDVIQEIRGLSDIYDLDPQTLAESISKNFVSTHAILRKEENSSQSEIGKIIVEGHFFGTYSLSILNREFSQSLMKLRSDCCINEIDYVAEKRMFTKSSHNPSSFEIPNGRNIVTRNVYPPIANDMGGEWNFFHCFNWEETEFPAEYVAEFNYFLDGVTCASTEVQKILIDSGVLIPTSVVSLAREFSHQNEEVLVSKQDKFTFLHISSGFPRKGIDLLLSAFKAEFENDFEVKLVIKTFPNPHQNVKQQISNSIPEYLNERINVIESDFTDSAMLELYRNADCLVQPSRGEGFGLPIYEAQSTGLKVIATKWGGHSDFYLDKDKYGIDYRMGRSTSHVSSGKSLWAEPSIDSLKMQMRKVYLEGRYARTPKSDHDGWRESASKQIEFISKVISKNTKRERVAWLSSWDTKCGIAEYSYDLVRHLSFEELQVFSPFDVSPLDRNAGVKNVRCWSPGIGNASQLVTELEKFHPTILVIQYNLGFFSIPQMEELLSNTENLTRIIEIHSLRDNLGNPHKNFVKILDYLNSVDRILVHSLEDLNYLHQAGLSKQAVLFSHPIPDYGFYVSHQVTKKKKIKIGTSGFSLPHKGHVELIEAIDSLSKDGIEVELMLFTPEHPDPTSKTHLQSIRVLMEKYKQLDIYLDESFHTEHQIISRLSECDLLIYPHQSTGEAASGTVQHGLASGRPVIATPSTIFSDVSDCLYFSGGFTPGALKNCILTVMDKLSAEHYEKKIEDAVKNHLSINNFQSTAKKFEGMVLGLINRI
jgi:glycosyltransferase involved in cell wall biosynthesis